MQWDAGCDWWMGGRLGCEGRASILMGLGYYAGGEFSYYNKENIDIRNKMVLVDGCQRHQSYHRQQTEQHPNLAPGHLICLKGKSLNECIET